MQYQNIHRLTFIKKLVIGFVISGLFMLAALVYAVVGLLTMHNMEIEVVRKDIPAATLVISLGDQMLGQQRYAGRFLILGSSEFKTMFEQNANEFRAGLARLKQLAPGSRVSSLERSHARYAELCGRLFAGGPVDGELLKKAAADVDNNIDTIRIEQLQRLEERLKVSDEHKAHTVTWIMVFAFGGLCLALLISGYTIFTFISSIKKLQKATHRIADGDFDHDPQIRNGDEIGALSQDFMRMAVRLKDLEQLSLDASPLTRLPGNIAIERSINLRLREKTSFAMCYLDLDNFKSYNDRYGYIRASELIKEAGRVIYDAVDRLNDPDAFVGHIGGDDFVVVIRDELAQFACQNIIRDIDDMIPAYYSDADRAAGAIEGFDRFGVPRSFPLISISIAALVCHPGDYHSAAEIATAAAEVKDHIKASSGSNYMVVQR